MWEFWSEQLAGMEQDFRCDAAALEGACVAYAEAVWAYKRMKHKGRTANIYALAKNGRKVLLKTQARPEVMIYDRNWRLVRSFCSEMGLTLVSRTRLHTDKPSGAQDDLLAILAAPRDRRAEVVQ